MLMQVMSVEDDGGEEKRWIGSKEIYNNINIHLVV